MTDNKRMREGGYGREVSREEYRGGYDPGFLTGGDGYRRTGRDRADTAATSSLTSWAVTIERYPAGSTGVAMTPASLVELFAAAPTVRQRLINDANKPWELNTSPYSMEWNHDWFNRSRLSTPTNFHQTYRATNI